MRLLAAAGSALLVAGCLSRPGLDSGGNPLVAARSETVASALPPERAAVVAEIRAQAEASEALTTPDAFQPGRTAALAAREEPRSVADVEAIQAELLLIAQRQAAAADPAELAALEARARELRLLAAAAQAGALRQ